MNCFSCKYVFIHSELRVDDFSLESFYVCESCLHVCMHTMCVSGSFPQKPEEGIGCPETAATSNCELLCGHWKPHLAPLQVLLLAELFFQP